MSTTYTSPDQRPSLAARRFGYVVAARAAGDLVSTSVGMVAMIVIWRVLPLDLSPGFERLARVLLAIGLVGTAIGILSATWKVLRPPNGSRGSDTRH